MDLKTFRVRMYKGILDSGWVDIDSLTVLVGKNESGKTSLLKALHKLNPYESDPYEMVKEWPRGLRTERSEEHVVCVARFQLSDQEKSELTEITNIEKIPDIVEASRNYAGKLEIKFEEELSLDKSISVEIDTTEIDAILDKLPKVRDNFSNQFKKYADECLNEARRLASEKKFVELEQLIQTHKPLLKEKRVQSHVNSYRAELQFTNQYLAGLDKLVHNLPPLLSVQSKVGDYLIKHLPTFIYMDDYRAFSGTAHLNDIKTRRDSERSTEEDKTFLTILGLSNLDLDDLVQLGQGTAEQVEERQYDLDDGAATLTKIISGRFRQRRYEVTYRADGLSFFTFVKDSRDPALIKLEERSKGFQWFFSFDLMFMHESKGTFEGCVILLDEPGLHLHPEAQRDLFLRLEEYAKGNTLLYTTHLPFMIDLNHPDRVRVLKETESGIVVTTDFIESPPEAKFVLQAALGMDASQSFLIAERNLVVEGVNDYWVLTELSNLLQQDGKEGLPRDVLITPAGSASTVVHIATIMIGQNLDVVALFDSDDEGRRAQGKLDHNWLTRYKGTQTKTLLLGNAVGACGDFALEDLFPESFITDTVKEVYSRQLVAAGVDEITLLGEDTLWRKIKRFMEDQGIEGINKGPLAKQLRNKLSGMKDVSELPEGTEEKAVKLFQEIRNAFGEK